MRAFVLPSNNMPSAVRINLEGREPFGVVAPGQDYEQVCDELRDRLLELKNPATGRSAVQWLRRADELYQGARLQDMPDLFIEWDHTVPISALESARVGRVTGILSADRTGDHWQQGLLHCFRAAKSPRSVPRMWLQSCWIFSGLPSRPSTKDRAR